MDNANLRGAKLYNVWFKDASLLGVDFSDAENMVLAAPFEPSLSRARRLRGATLPDGRRYNGCYNLKEDIEAARRMNIDTGNPKAMADFYGVSLEKYLRGQE